MGIISTISNAIYAGQKTGPKKDGTVWLALRFKAPECHRGVEILPEKLPQSNFMIFTGESFDMSLLNTLKENQRYHLQVDVIPKKDGVNYSLLKVLPAQ